MQLTLDLVFARQKEEKKKVRELKRIVKDGFANSKAYQETVQEIDRLKKKKAEIERAINEQYAEEHKEIDRLRLSIARDADLLTDLAMTKLMKGETVELQDENEIKYEPKFRVSFRKR